MTDRITSLAPRVLPGLSLLLFAAVSILALPPATQAAGKVQANLRVVTWQGRILFDGKARTGTTRVKPNSDCLGGSAGPARTVAGPTALGLLVAATKKPVAKKLRPLEISDGSFGFGICGIGGVSAQNEEWWVLRQNQKDTTTGAELTMVKKNDSILLYLSKTWMEPTPDTLLLKAPARVRKGSRARVRVFSYTGTGKRSPVEGARVKGAVKPTNANGFTRIRINGRTRTVARKSGLIPSNRTVIRIKRVKPKRR